MEIREENLEFLLARLHERPSHQAIVAAFATMTPEQLLWRYRTHKLEGNEVKTREEIQARREMDDWLGEVSLIYLAGLCGYSQRLADSPHKDEILKILDHPSLRPYYEQHYPIAPPCLLRLELTGVSRLESPSAPGAFEVFVNMNERFRSDEDLMRFLDYLDGFWYVGATKRIGIHTVVGAFSNPDRVVEALMKPRPEVTVLDSGIIGLLRFATFSTDLIQFLRICQPAPILQSAFWFFYAFWYREYREDASKLSMAALDHAIAASGTKVAIAAESRAELSHTMTALSDGSFAIPILDKAPGLPAHFASYRPL